MVYKDWTNQQTYISPQVKQSLSKERRKATKITHQVANGKILESSTISIGLHLPVLHYMTKLLRLWPMMVQPVANHYVSHIGLCIESREAKNKGPTNLELTQMISGDHPD